LNLAAERSDRSAHSEDAAIPGLEVSLWEQMLAPENLSRALRRVRANRGAPGVDGMTTDGTDAPMDVCVTNAERSFDVGEVP
jgi:RNA-directed DNA polymerase